jgi:hypothetical protein
MVLALGVSAIAACSDDPKPGAGTGGSSGLPIPVGGDGGDSGGPAVGDAESEASTNACNTIPNTAPAYDITFSTAAGPAPFVGGTIQDGTYFLTSEVRYGEPAAAPISSPGITLTIAGSSMKYGAYTTEKKYVPMSAQLVVPVANPDAGDPDAAAEAGAPPGDRVVITSQCPIAGSSLGPLPYSVVGKDFTIGFGLYTVTYTKQ